MRRCRRFPRRCSFVGVGWSRWWWAPRQIAFAATDNNANPLLSGLALRRESGARAHPAASFPERGDAGIPVIGVQLGEDRQDRRERFAHAALGQWVANRPAWGNLHHPAGRGRAGQRRRFARDRESAMRNRSTTWTTSATPTTATSPCSCPSSRNEATNSPSGLDSLVPGTRSTGCTTRCIRFSRISVPTLLRNSPLTGSLRRGGAGRGAGSARRSPVPRRLQRRSGNDAAGRRGRRRGAAPAVARRSSRCCRR